MYGGIDCNHKVAPQNITHTVTNTTDCLTAHMDPSCEAVINIPTILYFHNEARE